MWIACLGLIIGLAYVSVCHREKATLLRTLFKTLPLTCFAISALQMSGSPWLVLALGLSAFGDAFLSREGERNFMAGLISFAAAHLAYVVIFTQPIQLPHILVIMALAGYLALIFSKILPFAGDLRAAVAVYGALIALMALTGFGYSLGFSDGAWLGAGILLFLISDSLLGLQKFNPSPSFARREVSMAIWLTYLLGQFLILFALR